MHHGARSPQNPNTYNFCPIEGTAAAPGSKMSDQQRMLKHGASELELQEEGRKRWQRAAEDLAAFESTGPLGYQQMWCQGPDACALRPPPPSSIAERRSSGAACARSPASPRASAAATRSARLGRT